MERNDRDLSYLFTHFAHPKLSLRNRVVMAPMTRTSAGDDGVPTEAMADYYARRAQGGAGLIITEGTYTDLRSSKGYVGEPGAVTAGQMRGWERVVERVHAHDAKIALQLFHTGRQSTRKVLSGVGQGFEPIAPSALAPLNRTHEVPREMNAAEMAHAIAGFADTARRCRDVGFDAVEIHGAHGYLLDQFVWSASNRRTDEYGGSFQDRIRFPTEVASAVRAAVGTDYPIIYRFSQWKLDDYEARSFENSDELGLFLGALQDAGVDIFHASAHVATDAAFAGSMLTLSGWTRRLSGLPTIAVGGVSYTRSFADAYKGDAVAEVENPHCQAHLLTEGQADLLAVGRAMIANPNWADLVRRGRWSELRPFHKDLTRTLW